MARKGIKMKVAPEDMTPEQRAGAFSEGTFTASQTGAAQQARNPLRIKKRIVKEIVDTSSNTDSFERLINGG